MITPTLTMLKKRFSLVAILLTLLYLGCAGYLFVGDKEEKKNSEEEAVDIGQIIGNPLTPADQGIIDHAGGVEIGNPVAGGLEIGNPVAGGIEIGNPFILNLLDGKNLAGGLEIGNPIRFPTNGQLFSKTISTNQGTELEAFLKEKKVNLIILITDQLSSGREIKDFHLVLDQISLLDAGSAQGQVPIDSIDDRISLLELTDGKTAFVGSALLPDRQFRGIELAIGRSTGILIDEVLTNLHHQQRVQILAQFSIETADMLKYIIVLDFKPEESLIEQNGNIYFKPAIEIKTFAIYDGEQFKLGYHRDRIEMPIVSDQGQDAPVQNDPVQPRTCDPALPCCSPDGAILFGEFCRNDAREFRWLCESKEGSCGGTIVKYERGIWCDGIRPECPENGSVVEWLKTGETDCNDVGLTCYDHTKKCSEKAECR